MKRYMVQGFPALNDVKYYRFYLTALICTFFRSMFSDLTFELNDTKTDKYKACFSKHGIILISKEETMNYFCESLEIIGEGFERKERLILGADPNQHFDIQDIEKFANEPINVLGEDHPLRPFGINPDNCVPNLTCLNTNDINWKYSESKKNEYHPNFIFHILTRNKLIFAFKA